MRMLSSVLQGGLVLGTLLALGVLVVHEPWRTFVIEKAEPAARFVVCLSSPVLCDLRQFVWGK